MEKIIVTAYGRTIKFSDIEHTFAGNMSFFDGDASCMVGAILKNGEFVCIARLFDVELSILLHTQIRGICNHPECIGDVYNVNVELESLKTLQDVFNLSEEHKVVPRELLLQGALQQLIDGVQPPKSKFKKNYEQ